MFKIKKEREKEGPTEISQTLELDAESFEEILSKSDNFVVDCWNTHCVPCRKVHPMIDEMAVKFRGKIVFGKLNTDEYVDVAVKYGVMSVPTVLVFKNGKKKGSITHISTKDALEHEILRMLEV